MEGQAQDRIVLRLCQEITSDVGEYLKQRYKGGDYAYLGISFFNSAGRILTLDILA
jgi:hypothetical protein